MRPAASMLIVLCVCAAAATPAAGQESTKADALVGLARVKRDAGDLDAARRYFDQAEQLRPLTPSERAEYFWVLAGHDPAAALAVGHAVLEDRPDAADVRDRMIAEAIGIEDEATASRLAGEGHRLTPDLPLWPRRMAESAMRQGRPAEAAEAYAAAVAAEGSATADRAGLALALEAAGAADRAADAWAAVPADIISTTPAWAASRLRALVQTAPPRVAASELERWLALHPGDDEMREALVEVWSRAGEPARALDAMAGMSPGPRERLRHREAEVARAAGDRPRAIAVLEDLAARQAATPDERRRLVELLLDASRADRAAAVLRPLALTAGCRDAELTLVVRLPEPAATDLLLEVVSSNTASCAARPSWTIEAVRRLVAAGRHGDALKAIALLPGSARSGGELRRLHGQLLLWTGDAAGAIVVLEPHVAAAPGDTSAREALSDAYRARHRAYDAWDVARPLLESPLSAARLIALAETALEADDPAPVGPILERLEREQPYGLEPPAVATMQGLAGRAALALGRPRKAAAILAAIAPAELNPAAALALIDSTIAVDGHGAALPLARRPVPHTTPWTDVLARQALVETVAGDRRRSAAIEEVLDRLDPAAAAVLEVESLLALERPHEALARLARLPDASETPRLADLLAVALAGAGEAGASAEIVDRLAARRPRLVSFAIRRSETAWQLSRTPAAFDALVALVQRFPGHQDAAIAAARAVAFEGQHERALALLVASAPLDELPLAGRAVAATSLRALGRTSDALRLLEDLPAPQGRVALLRAELVSAVRGWAHADREFRDLAAVPSAPPAAFLAWAEAAPSADERVRVLDAAVGRFPDAADVLVSLAEACLQTGRVGDARSAARRALDRDRRSGRAWLVLAEATAAAGSRAAFDEVLSDFAASDPAPALLVGMADRLAGLARAPGDAALARALAWLDEVPAGGTLGDARDLARARVLAAGERWDAALAAIDDVLARDARQRQALRLRADVLSWSGRHPAALAAYDAYLEVAPLDRDARRQQARVAGWGGRFDLALGRYEALIAGAPADRAVHAEAAAKRAFFEGRWRAASAAYHEWLAVEPGSAEALFELAEVQRALGQQTAADATLARLEAQPAGHRLAAAAHERARLNARPSVVVFTGRRAADGYAGQRLLDLYEHGATVAGEWGSTRRTTLKVRTATLRATAAGARRQGYQAGVGLLADLSSAWHVDAGVEALALGTRRAEIDARVQFGWQPTDRWLVRGGVERRPLLESLHTLDRGLTTSDVFAQLVFESPTTSVDLRAGAKRLSDGNRGRQTTFSATRALGQARSGVRAVMWAEHLAYHRPTADYFAPRSFLRVDGGLEYVHRLSRPRFRGDRENSLAAGYLVGFDSRGVRYHHRSVRFSYEVASGLAFDARGSWIRSADYDETRFTIGMRVGGSSGRR